MAEKPLTLDRPFLILGEVVCDGPESIGSSDLAGSKADTSVIDTM